MKKLILIFTFLCLQLLGFSDALRFSTDAITADTKILMVGRPSKLTCNYVKFRTESVREITWFAGYNGINTKIFHYHVTAGTKQGTDFGFIKTDEASATDNELTITIPEYRSPFLTIGCEVEVLRDSGYGKLKTLKKLEESNITVVASQQHQLVMKAGNELGLATNENDAFAAVGEPFVVKCMSAGVEPAPKLTLTINSEPWEQNHPGQIFDNPLDAGILYNRQTVGSSITGRLHRVTSDMFQGGNYGSNKYMNVECVAMFDDHIFDKKQLSVKQVDSTTSVNSYLGPPATGPSPSNPYLRDPARSGSTNPYLREPGLEDSNQYIAPEISRGGYENADSRYNPNRSYENSSGRQGKVINYDEMYSRLMDLVDPARHNHPGIPYDFFSGYILMMADNIDEPDQYSVYSSGPSAPTTVTILGRLPEHVISEFQSSYGRYNQLSNERFRVKMEAVEVLNILGSAGFRVVDSTVSKSGKLVWTLEKKQFDVPSTSGHDREF